MWSSYSARQAANLLGLPESVVRSCIRDGLVGNSTVPAQLTFRDLATLRIVQRFLARGLTSTQVRKDLVRIANTLAPGASLSELALELRGPRLEVVGSMDGQMALPLAPPAPPASGAVVPLPRPGSRSNLVPLPLATADDWFAKATELEASDVPRAIDAYRRGLSLRPDAADVWINLGRLHADRNEPGLAKECFMHALELDPHDATCHYNLGVVAQDEGREVEAIRLYRRALEIDPAIAEAHYNLATLFDRTGDGQSAIRHINEYRRLTKAT